MLMLNLTYLTNVVFIQAVEDFVCSCHCLHTCFICFLLNKHSSINDAANELKPDRAIIIKALCLSYSHVCMLSVLHLTLFLKYISHPQDLR